MSVPTDTPARPDESTLTDSGAIHTPTQSASQIIFGDSGMENVERLYFHRDRDGALRLSGQQSDDPKEADMRRKIEETMDELGTEYCIRLADFFAPNAARSGVTTTWNEGVASNAESQKADESSAESAKTLRRRTYERMLRMVGI